MAYLTNLPKGETNRLISGQHVDNTLAVGWRYYAPHERLYQETGKRIGFLEGTYEQHWLSAEEQEEQNRQLNQQLIEHWNNGGLVGVYWPATNPWTGESQKSERGGDLVDLITPGTAVHDVWMGKLDWIAGWLAELQDAGVVVHWRPFHECNAHWFWWGDQDGVWPPLANAEELKAIYQHMWKYFTHDKGLNNLLWVYSPYTWADHLVPQMSLDSHYPGDEYVDIISPSYYHLPKDGVELGHLPASWEAIADSGKVLALGEFGPGCADVGQLCSDIGESFDCLAFIESVKQRCPEISYFAFWSREWAAVEQENADGLMNDAWVITREEVDWRTTK